jgi:hypothetical protein
VLVHTYASIDIISLCRLRYFSGSGSQESFRLRSRVEVFWRGSSLGGEAFVVARPMKLYRGRDNCCRRVTSNRRVGDIVFERFVSPPVMGRLRQSPE